VALPRLGGVTDNSKIASELSTAASVQSAIDACHGEWIINEGTFTCGASIDSSTLNAQGYPATDTLGTASNPLNAILKSGNNIGWTKSGTKYYGPATDPSKGAKNKAGKPGKGDWWEYDAANGLFELKES